MEEKQSAKIRKFRQINRVKGGLPHGHEYLAKEIWYEQQEDGLWKSTILMDDDTQVQGHTVDDKIFNLKLNGFDIVRKRSDGAESVDRFPGLLESKCFEEIVG